MFPSDSLVFVQECNQHEYIENPDFIDKSLVFKWSHQATDIILFMGIKNGATPKVILRNIRDKNCFTSSAEPTMMQHYNKIYHKIMNLTDHIEDTNTHQMRQKVENHIEVPDNDFEAYISYYYIHDYVEYANKT